LQDEGESLPDKVLSAGIGHKLRATITPQGKVRPHEDITQQVELIVKQLLTQEGITDQRRQEKVRHLVRERYGARATVSRLEQLFGNYPAKPVGISDCWEKPLIINLTTPTESQVLRTNRTTCLDSVKLDVEPGEYILKESGAVVTSSSALSRGTPVMTTRMTGTQNSTVEVNAATGWLRAMATSLHYDGVRTSVVKGRGGRTKLRRVLFRVDSKTATDIQSN